MPVGTGTRVLFFDIFGTTVEWRTCVTRALQQASHRALQHRQTHSPALHARALAMTDDNWLGMAEDWRASYYRFTEGFDPSSPRAKFISVDQHHYESLVELLQQRSLHDLFLEHELRDLAKCWHRLDPWEDTIEGLELLSTKFRTCTLSNGNLDLLQGLVAHARLPFTDLISAEFFSAYKPSPRVYLGAAERLGVAPAQCVLVAAHLNDLRAARECGFGTIFVERVKEEPGSWKQAVRDGYLDFAVGLDSESKGFVEVARLLGIGDVL
ncbi:HAD-like domain-containing protein [Aspergillus carlsbadensis]|nr:HAD-like domain-containing protein [Aspergillus carlsbadensis]